MEPIRGKAYLSLEVKMPGINSIIFSTELSLAKYLRSPRCYVRVRMRPM